MPKRGGLGQRGLDLLISASPGAGDKSAAEEKSASKEKSSEKKNSKTSGKSTVKAGTKNTSKSSTAAKSAGKNSTGKGSGKNAGTAKKGPKGNADKNVKVSKAKSQAVAEIEKAIIDTADANNTSAITTNTHADLQPDAGAAAENVSAVLQGVQNEPLELPIELVEPNRGQPRKNFDDDALQELADSIKQFGVIQPLIVQKKDDYYEIIAGERRWRASRIAGLKKIPVIVKDYSDKEAMEISLIENIQREDLNPIEEAFAYKRLMEEYDLRQDEVAQRVSRSRAAIANSVRLLNLDQRVQDMVVSEMLTTGHARALLAITDPEVQYETAQKVFDEKMSVREVERLVRKLQEGPRPEKKPPVSDTLMTVYAGMEEAMKMSLGTKVTISPKSAQKGRIEIEYYSAEDLDRLCDLLKTPQNQTGGD